MEKVPSQEKFDVEKSPLREAYILLGAHTPLELSNFYTEEDQKIFPEKWDYKNPDLLINKVKNFLENKTEEGLTEDEKEWRQEILWFWYHHAISCAVARYKDKEAAQTYAAKALEIQPKDHPNRITKLLDLLVNDKLVEAEHWVENMPTTNEDEKVEKDTAIDLIKGFKEKGFFE